MTDRPPGSPRPDQGQLDDATRDIRLTPPAGRPEWVGAGRREEAPVHEHEPPMQPIPVRELPAQPSAGPPPTVADAPVAEIPAVAPSEPDPTVVVPAPHTSYRESSTDELQPTAVPPREQTRPFEAPPDQGPSIRRPEEAPAARRSGGGAWSWVLLVLLPIAVIAVAGVLLSLVLGG